MKKTKIAVTGLAISISLFSMTALATAKARFGEMHPSEILHQTYNYKAKEDLFVMGTKFRVNWASEVTKPVVGVKASTKSENNQTKMKSAKQALKLAPKEKASSRRAATATSNKTHTLEISSGNKIKYSRLIPVKATAYTAAAEENGLWGPYDYFGNPLKLGTIAVDPDVIPMGSTVYITGYTFNGLPSKGMIAKAMDMGSAIQGKRVDIFVPTSRADASKFGMQDVKVYILK